MVSFLSCIPDLISLLIGFRKAGASDPEELAIGQLSHRIFKVIFVVGPAYQLWFVPTVSVIVRTDHISIVVVMPLSLDADPHGPVLRLIRKGVAIIGSGMVRNENGRIPGTTVVPGTYQGCVKVL